MAAIIFIVYSLITMVQMVAIGGMPETAEEGFALLRENRVVGLLRLDILTLFILPLYYLLFLGLYAALRRINEAYVTLAVLMGCVGLTLVLATPSALSFVTLILRKNRGSQFCYFFHELFGSGSCQSLVKQQAISSA